MIDAHKAWPRADSFAQFSAYEVFRLSLAGMVVSMFQHRMLTGAEKESAAPQHNGLSAASHIHENRNLRRGFQVGSLNIVSFTVPELRDSSVSSSVEWCGLFS
ncbi:hypothetical protein TNCV_1130051 [Trichonephila clavipes]|nr:hypothetical protein TNCV_1130051 [Trichonephila clavipes]